MDSTRPKFGGDEELGVRDTGFADRLSNLVFIHVASSCVKLTVSSLVDGCKKGSFELVAFPGSD